MARPSGGWVRELLYENVGVGEWLATIAIPNFMRARARSQATACKQDLRIIDAAIDQWAMEKNKKNGDTVTVTELKAYVKDNTPLYTALAAGTAKDTLGSTVIMPTVGGQLAVPQNTYDNVKAIVEDAFWSPFAAPAAAP